MFRRVIVSRPVLATLSLSCGALALNATAKEKQVPTLSSLVRAYVVFSLCSLPSLVDASPHILSFLSAVPVLRQTSDAFLRLTFFHQFVGAETVDGCIPLLHTLRKSNQGALFSYSVEQLHSSPSSSQHALHSILHSIDIAADFDNTPSTWVAIKLSTLLPDPSSLRLLSSSIIIHQNKLHPTQIPFPYAPNTHHIPLIQHLLSLQSLLSNLRAICSHAKSRNIKLTIDAEESWFQPAIDIFSILLMQEFNSPNSSPLVYSTIQAYLTRTPSFLNFLINHAKSNDYSLGIKLVRGAYIDAEIHAHAHPQSLSISPDKDPPTFPEKALTDDAYNHCVRVLVREVASNPAIAVLFGTHNWDSSRLVLDEIVNVGLGKRVDNEKILLSERARKGVCMAQLYGTFFPLSLSLSLLLTRLRHVGFPRFLSRRQNISRPTSLLSLCHPIHPLWSSS